MHAMSSAAQELGSRAPACARPGAAAIMRVPAGPGRTGAGLGLMADYFISYTSSDRDWAQWIGKELEALAHTPHIHEWEIKGGDDIYAWMEARHDAADHVLCVVSDEYLKAPYSTLERNAALWQAAKNRTSFVLFVVVKPCRLPTLIDHIRRCELFGVPEEAARTRFQRIHEQPRGARRAPPFRARCSRSPTFRSGCRPISWAATHELAAIEAALKIPPPRKPEGRGSGHHDAARDARRRQDHARGLLRGAPSRRLPGDLVDQGADRGRHARRSGGARRAARLGRRRRQGGAGACGRDGAAAARGRGHPAHLRQRGRCRCAQALPAARRRLPGAGHLERAGLARGRDAGRDPASGRRRSAPTI